MQNLDDAVTRYINALAGKNSVLDFCLIHASAWAVPILVLAVAAQWWIGNDRSSNRHVLIAAGFSFGLALAINQVILLFVHRVRPYDMGITRLMIERSNDSSFPSDHATATIAIAAAFFLNHSPRRGVVFALLAVVICVSRVYIGTHYASDVLGGAITGVLGAYAVSILYRQNTRLDRILTRIL